MPKAKQLTIPCRNRPGTLAQIAKVLGDAKVNIVCCLTTSSGARGAVQVVVDNVNRARKALAAAGLPCRQSDVLYVTLPNKPGALGRFAGKLARKKINITQGYATAARGSGRAGLLLAVSNVNKAARVK